MFNDSEFKFSTSKTNFIDYVKEHTLTKENSLNIDSSPRKGSTIPEVHFANNIVEYNNPLKAGESSMQKGVDEQIARNMHNSTVNSNQFTPMRTSTNTISKSPVAHIAEGAKNSIENKTPMPKGVTEISPKLKAAVCRKSINSVLTNKNSPLTAVVNANKMVAIEMKDKAVLKKPNYVIHMRRNDNPADMN